MAKREQLTASEEYWLFYFHLGFAFTRWAEVEEGMIVLLCEFINDFQTSKLWIDGFFSIENFRSKVAFVDSILKPRIDDFYRLEEWGKLVDRINKASTKRNKLAHHRVQAFGRSPAGRRYGLASSFIPKKMDRHESDAICLKEVVAIGSEFSGVSQALMEYASVLRQTRGQPPRVPARLPDPPTIQTLRAQMHEALGHPLAPSPRKS